MHAIGFDPPTSTSNDVEFLVKKRVLRFSVHIVRDVRINNICIFFLLFALMIHMFYYTKISINTLYNTFKMTCKGALQADGGVTEAGRAGP